MKSITLLFLGITQCIYIFSQKQIEFDTINWETHTENIVKFKGRTCLVGAAKLKNTKFVNAIIEFDVWTNGERSYPGINFRVTPNGNSEHLYIRPHVTGKDLAVQYTPSYFGSSCWQLYHGKGYTTKAIIKQKQWVHFKVEIKDDIALFYLDNSEIPTLDINLVMEINKGELKLNTTRNSIYFSNFKFKKLEFSSNKTKPNLYSSPKSDWEISKLLEKEYFDQEGYPGFRDISTANWEKVESSTNGMLNISKHRKIIRGKKNCVYARKTIFSDKDKTVKLAFGYSDAIRVFHNEKLLYSGNYAYKSRGSSFSGNIGLYDTLHINLQKGLNELFLIAKDDFGGWGFRFKANKELVPLKTSNNNFKKGWVTPKGKLIPEAAVYDPKTKCIYYSNFDTKFKESKTPISFITKLNLKGEVIKHRWIDSLYAPCGICIHDDKLYVTERHALTVISIKNKKVIRKYDYPEDMVFANDVTVDDEGVAYITNSCPIPGITAIYRLKNDKIEPWIASNELYRSNAILYDNGHLILGNNGLNKLQKINIKTKEIKNIASLACGIIDGIKKDENGDYLVSLWKGELYKIKKNGSIVHLFSSNGKYNIADFEYIADKKMIIAPTFYNNNVIGFKFEE